MKVQLIHADHYPAVERGSITKVSAPRSRFEPPNHHHHHHHQGFKRARHEVFCLCCCCCYPSVRKTVFLTLLLVALLVCGFLSLSEPMVLLVVCLFSRHPVGPVFSVSLSTVSWEPRGVPRGTGTYVLLGFFGHAWWCDEESQQRCRESASLRITDPVSLEQ